MDGNISEDEKCAIEEFILHEKSSKGIKISTLGTRLSSLRVAAKRTDTDLTNMSQHQYNKLIDKLDTEYGLADSTIRNYQSSLRLFFLFHNKEWAEEIKTRKVESTVDVSELPTEEEVQKLLDAANHPREKSFIALHADSGLRVGAICSLPVGNVDLSGQIAVVKINEKAFVKGASGNIPLTFSRPYLANYLDVHPRSDRDDVAFFHRKPGMYDSDSDGAVSANHMRTVVKEVADDAGVPRNKVKLHAFRHAAITRWVREGFSEKAIKHRATWVDTSDMLKIYDHVTEEEINKHIAAKEGVYDLEADGEQPASLMDCDLCGTTIRTTVKYCPGCGHPQTVDAAHKVPPEGVQHPDETANQLDQLDGALDNISMGMILSRAIEKDPSLLEEINVDQEVFLDTKQPESL